MKIKPLDWSKFQLSELLTANSEHAHDVFRGSLDVQSSSPWYGKKWYAKAMHNHQVACFNLLASEIYRLICSSFQPHSLIAKTDDNEWFYLSEDLGEDYCSSERLNLRNRELGLASVLLVALWLHEVDLKCDNLLIHRETLAVAKIDPEFSFYSLFKTQHQHEITARMVRFLPVPHGYPVHNWLRYVVNNTEFKLRHLSPLGDVPDVFISDKYRALLKMVLLPNIFIELLCKNILFKVQQDHFYEFLIKRISEIKRVAMSDSDFLAYASTKEAAQQADDFIQKLLSFEVQQLCISSTHKALVEAEYKKNREELARISSPSMEKENTFVSLSMFSSSASCVPNSKEMDAKLEHRIGF